jgi:glycosyltransferase involved in cell wall biosynthesis
MCLRSIVAQTYRNIEAVVADSNSTDGTVEKARELGATVLEFPRDVERTYAKNVAARHSDAHFLMFLDSDIELGTDTVAACLEACRSSDAVIVPQRVAPRSGYWARCRALEVLTYEGDDLVESPTFFKRDVFLAAGGFDEQLVFGEENDLSLRIRKLGFKVSRTRSYVWHHEDSLKGVIMRKFYYGRTAPGYLYKARGMAFAQFTPVRPAWLRNWRILVKDPLHSTGMVVQKMVQYFAAGIGLLFGLIESVTAMFTQRSDTTAKSRVRRSCLRVSGKE